ncbi:MAG: bifunctional diaminohydroxyphosphoribosylaminopyrimidine deaminase/5-amino-6-(5-phosphoribosylamino)uracil reductase RibD [Deltaproteobacteria bacterium]|nr:bifunctional diaminohydroxyphosphoribosylaminopyrimidine deaminase/5-amino-6-(5-phosphoribosylamino)uracil reductase RibD [Deltaproteobacteria bacterium]
MSPKPPADAVIDERFMREALALAKKGLGKTSPNPTVGAVIVKNGRVIARGFHKKAGRPHAEIAAFKDAKESVKGATLYVTLEPCCHYGKTPPCTGAVVRSGIKRVVAGMLDPNRLVAGKGAGILRRAGIDVTSGVLELECAELNEWYIKYITKKMPYVTLKLAMSIDGRIATAAGESKWITGVEARRHVHKMRSESDAVMVGLNTVLKDDPALTVRLVKGKNPARVVVDSSLRTPLDAKIFDNAGKVRLIIFTTNAAPADKIKKARAKGAEVVTVPKSAGMGGGVDLKKVLRELGSRAIASLLVEGGGSLGASFIKACLVDRISFFIAPIVLGGGAALGIGPLGIKKMSKALVIKDMTMKRIGKDILIEGHF